MISLVNEYNGLIKEQKNLKDLFVITDWLSPDEKYCIFLDELYDIESKTKIGNIWENFDYFKMFLKHSFEVSTTITEEIRKSVLNSINNLILTESRQNITMLKPIVKDLISENIFGDAWDYARNTAIDSVSGIKDFVIKSAKGTANLVNSISNGDWASVLDLIKKGTLFVARKLKSALYNPIGMILDAILLATGVGKSAMFVVWSIVVALDIYEFTTGDFEDKDLNILWHLLFLGVDILGLVFAGAVAKTAKTAIGGFIRKFGKSAESLSKAMGSSKFLTDLVQKIFGATSKASGLMQKSLSYLEKNSPKLYKFVNGTIGSLGTLLKKLTDGLGRLLKGGLNILTKPGNIASKAVGGGKLGKSVEAAVNVAVPITAFGTYSQRQKNNQIINQNQIFSDDQLKTIASKGLDDLLTQMQ